MFFQRKNNQNLLQSLQEDLQQLELHQIAIQADIQRVQESIAYLENKIVIESKDISSTTLLPN